MALTLSEAKNRIDTLKRDVAGLGDDLDAVLDTSNLSDFEFYLNEALSDVNDLAAELRKLSTAGIVPDGLG